MPRPRRSAALQQLDLDEHELAAAGINDTMRDTARPVVGLPRLVVAPTARPRYTLDELLAQCDDDAALSAEDRAWLDAKPVGNELL